MAQERRQTALIHVHHHMCCSHIDKVRQTRQIRLGSRAGANQRRDPRISLGQMRANLVRPRHLTPRQRPGAAVRCLHLPPRHALLATLAMTRGPHPAPCRIRGTQQPRPPRPRPRRQYPPRDPRWIHCHLRQGREGMDLVRMVILQLHLCLCTEPNPKLVTPGRKLIPTVQYGMVCPAPLLNLLLYKLP
jgi:hypothetical protein